MAGRKRIRFESWKYPHREDQARALIKNMLDMGRPVVNRDGRMSRLKYNGRSGIQAVAMGKDELLAEINMTTDYLVQKWEKAVDHAGKPVMDPNTGEAARRICAVIGDVHHRVINTAYGLGDENGLWELRGTLTHPIVNGDGRIVIRNGLHWRDADVNGMTKKKAAIHLADGYDPVSEYFFAVPEKVAARLEGTGDRKPTAAEVRDAVDTVNWLVCDFTFATESAKASLFAFMLTMVCREIIGDAAVPMLEVRAPVPQCGKSLMTEMMIRAVTGERASMFSPNFQDKGEFEKEYFSQLMRGRNYIFMDNVVFKVLSSVLDMAITAGYVEKRLLGLNEMGTVYAGMPHVMTANNPSMSEDMKQRLYLLDILKPPKGKEFFHKRPKSEAVEAQPDILWSLFTIFNHWDKNEGRPLFKERRMDVAVEWSEKIGGMLMAAGIPGFLVDTLKQIGEVDPKLEQAAGMARLWHEKHGGAWLYVKDAFEFAQEAGYVKEADSVQEKIQKIAARLAKLRMAPLPGGYRFERNEDDTRGSSIWRVAKDAGN